MLSIVIVPEKESGQMKDEAKKRLEELRLEYQAGARRMEQLELEKSELRSTMLRISGAIQVLEELILQPSKEEPTVGASEEDDAPKPVQMARHISTP